MPFNSESQPVKILAIATQGMASGDADRLRVLLSELPFEMYQFDKGAKLKSFVELLQYLFRERPNLVVMEGTGLAGGIALIIGRVLGSIPYIFSSGDAVGPYVGKFHPILGPIFSLYERILCRFCDGFIGWTPYLVGRALTFGARRGMTAAGWAPFEKTVAELEEARRRIRREYGIPDDHIVIGIAGSLNWNKRVGYCYGYELVKAVLETDRNDIEVLIVGDGEGRKSLEHLAGHELGRRVHFTGRVAREKVPDYLTAMDVASLPQSIDKVGNFRYTTKVSEYLSVGLPIVTGHLPIAYDFPKECFWRLAGETPWGTEYVKRLTQWMDEITLFDLKQKRGQLPRIQSVFDREQQIHSTTEFIKDVLSDVRNPFIAARPMSIETTREVVG